MEPNVVVKDPAASVILRIFLQGGILVQRLMPLGTAAHIIKNWMVGYYKMTPGKRFIGEVDGTSQTFALDTEAIMFMDISPSTPPSNFQPSPLGASPIFMNNSGGR